MQICLVLTEIVWWKTPDPHPICLGLHKDENYWDGPPDFLEPFYGGTVSF